MSISKRDVGIGIATLVVGAAVGALVGFVVANARLRGVPPPAFTGALFSDERETPGVPAIKEIRIHTSQAAETSLNPADWTAKATSIKLNPILTNYRLGFDFADSGVKSISVEVVLEGDQNPIRNTTLPSPDNLQHDDMYPKATVNDARVVTSLFVRLWGRADSLRLDTILVVSREDGALADPPIVFPDPRRN